MRPSSLFAGLRRVRASVMARLMLTLVLALGGVGTFQYFFLGGQIRRDLVSDQAELHEADARSLERRAAEAQVNVESPLSEATEVIVAIASRPNMRDVLLVDGDGAVLIGSKAGQVGRHRSDAKLRLVARSGREYRGVRPSGSGAYSYIFPVRMSGRRFALQIDRDASALEEDVAASRAHLGLFAILSLLAALPLFYLLGGRSVAATYMSALQRARRDGLTDLDNHRAFQDELERALGEVVRHSVPVTVALIDIDDFKFENDRHGHQHGDRILCELASILREARPNDRAFRLGGDEFALLLPHTSEAEADTPLERIRDAVRSRLGGVTASFGFSAATPEDREASTLWGRADAALLEAKRRGGDTVVAAGEIVDGVPVVTIEKVRAVRALIAGGDIDVAFQPIWDLGGSRVLGYEALARFESSELNGPGEAFEIADSIGRGHELDAVCRRAALREATGLPGDVLLFLNVSPQTLEHDGLAGDSLVQAVRGAGLEPERVVLEITERTDARKEVLQPETARLRALGFKVALDDVGAGNAGLEMLRGLPVDFIKIDRGVVSAAIDDRSARAVLLGIMAFAREIDAFVIAEGIETEAMLELARDPEPARPAAARGAQGAQGYLLGRPAPAPSAAPSYMDTLAALTQLTADRERRRVATTLQRSDALYRVLVRTLPDTFVALFDLDLRFQLAEGPALEALGWRRDELEGHTVAEAFPPDRAAALAERLRPALEGEAFDFEWPSVRGGAHLLVHAAPVQDERAGVIGVIVICRVTQGREVDAALRTSRSRPTSAPARLR
ncbi:MAG TPA: EAL domain-containing protein [Solirubrobacteraceae bacterium]|nr:EAL domain-containing protein [Solirubrobacteraceae bacterium]